MNKDASIAINILLLFLVIGLIFLVCQQEQQFKDNVSASMKDLIEMKADCEKSLPRDKVCVMVFDYVSVEADYE